MLWLISCLVVKKVCEFGVGVSAITQCVDYPVSANCKHNGDDNTVHWENEIAHIQPQTV